MFSHNCNTVEQLDAIVGGKITGIVEDKEEGVRGLTVECENRGDLIVWISCDPEGNGPGWLDIQEFK